MFRDAVRIGQIAGTGAAGPQQHAVLEEALMLFDQAAMIRLCTASLASLAGILGPVLATGLFGYFISARAPVHVPGAAFFCGSILMLIALLLALRSFRKNPLVAAASA